MLSAALDTRSPIEESGDVDRLLTTSSASPSATTSITVGFFMSSGSSDLRERLGERSLIRGEANLEAFCWFGRSPFMVGVCPCSEVLRVPWVCCLGQ